MQLLASEDNADHYTRPPGIERLLMHTLQAMAIHIHRQGRFNNHTVHSLYRIMVTISSVVGVMIMGNILLGVGIRPISLVFRVSVLSLHHVGFPDVTNIPTPTCLYSSLPEMSVHMPNQIYDPILFVLKI